VRGFVETANSATLDVESFGQGFLVMSVTPHKYWQSPSTAPASRPW